MTIPIIVITAYLIGSVSFGVVVSRAYRLPDPREYGSGNPGATNVLRSGCKSAAVLTLLGDCIKGWLAVFVAGQSVAADAEPVMALAAVAVSVPMILFETLVTMDAVAPETWIPFTLPVVIPLLDDERS